MNFGARMIATTAAAAFLAPALLFGAELPAKPSTSAAETTAADSRSASGASASVSLPSAPSPDQSGGPATSTSTATSMSPAAGHAAYPAHPAFPRVELFLGYSYLRAVPTLATGNRMEWLNGGSANIAFNINRYFGLVADVGGFRANEIEFTGTGAPAASVANASGNAFTYLAGPRLSFRKYDRVTPFAQALFGGIHASQVTLSGCTGRLCTPLPSENAFALTAGGGLDIKLARHVALRLIQAEYLMTRFANLTPGTSSTGNRDTQNDMRLSSGLVFNFGGAPPPPPVAYTCSTSPSTVFPGDPVAVTGMALNLNPKKTAVYTWSADGGAVSGTSSAANIDTKNLAPGTYTVKGHVSEGVKPGQMADCSAQYMVKAFEPPTVACSANPSSVRPGDASTITASGMSPQNRPLTYSYSSTAGSISGTTSTATLSTPGAAPGTITVTCGVVDDKGQTASSTASVTVVAPPVAPAPTTSSLCTVDFDHDARRPARVDNEAKACLDDVALDMQRSSDAKLALVGNAASKEKRGSKLASERAVNTKDYLVTEKGIDPSRISVFTGSQDGGTVATTLIPAGATLDTTGDTPVDEAAVKAQPRTAPKRHHSK